MSIPTNMTNKQLRLLAKIEKLLFEKKDYPFEEILKLAKGMRSHNSQSCGMETMKANARLGMNKDTVNRVILGAGACIH